MLENTLWHDGAPGESAMVFAVFAHGMLKLEQRLRDGVEEGARRNDKIMAKAVELTSAAAWRKLN